MVSLGKICLGSALLLLGLVCSHAVTPSSGGGGGGVSTLHSCSTSASCPKNSKGDAQVCDLLYPGSDGNGTCRTSCDPANPSCSNNEVCNPITAACEPKCGSDGACATSVPSGGTAKCTNGNYCVSIPNGTACPSNFSPSGGFCKLKDSVEGVTHLLKDPITNTLEVGCTTLSGSDACSNLTGLNLPAASSGGQATSYSYACSMFTSTCVPTCSQTPLVNCPGAQRTGCTIPDNTAGIGTCELSCGSSCPSGLSCKADLGLCGKSCNDTADCQSDQSCKFKPSICWGNG